MSYTIICGTEEQLGYGNIIAIQCHALCVWNGAVVMQHNTPCVAWYMPL